MICSDLPLRLVPMSFRVTCYCPPMAPIVPMARRQQPPAAPRAVRVPYLSLPVDRRLREPPRAVGW